MNKIAKTLIFSFCFFSFNANASFLWDLENGIGLYKKGHYKEAQNFFQSYLNNNPNDENGYFWLAKTYQKTDKNNENLSKENFKKAYEITFQKRNIEKIFFNTKNDSTLEDYFDMAVAYFEDGNYKQANRYADLMLKIDSKSASAYFIKAKIEYTKGNNEQAQEYLKLAVMYNNSIIETNLAAILGVIEIPQMTKEVCYFKAMESYYSGDLIKTKDYIEKYLEIDNKNIEIKNFLTDLALKTQDYSLAQKTIDEIFKANPNNIQNHINQAKLYKINNENEKIEPILNKAYKINPNNKELLFAFGNYYLDEKNFENARMFFENLILVDDEFYEGYFGYIYSLIQTKKFNEAISQIRKANAINPKSSEISFLLAQICILNGQYEEASSYIENSIKIEQNPIYFLENAKINYILQKYPQSIINLENALKSPYPIQNQEEIYEYFIKNYLKLNDIKKAQYHIQEKNKLDKNRILYKYNLYKLYKMQGNEKESSLYFTQLKKTKAITQTDYIDLSEFYFEETGIKNAIKILEEGLKKFPNSIPLYSQKIKFYYLTNDTQKIKEIIQETTKL